MRCWVCLGSGTFFHDVHRAAQICFGLMRYFFPRLQTRQLCGSDCTCRPEFSIIRLLNNRLYRMNPLFTLAATSVGRLDMQNSVYHNSFFLVLICVVVLSESDGVAETSFIMEKKLKEFQLCDSKRLCKMGARWWHCSICSMPVFGLEMWKNPAWYCAETAVNRSATSITQLTLSQVTRDEVDAASKLLEGMSEAPRYPKHPPQRIADLETATRQLRQLSCILDSCTISASQTQKALLLKAKGASTSFMLWVVMP